MAAKRFMLVGHGGFYNRGCEAIVRTTTRMLRDQFPGCEIVLASNDPENDRRHSAAEGIEILDNRVARWSQRWIAMKFREKLSLPPAPKRSLRREIQQAVPEADALVHIGGDNFTSDYSLTPHSGLLGVDEIAFENGLPVIVWGASIGPFKLASLEETVLDHLRRAALITVRESISKDYLAENGIADNVVLVTDPAMLLEPDPVDLSDFWPDVERVAALNVSALASGYRDDADLGFGQNVVKAVVDEVLGWDGWGCLLVPHVINPPYHDDHQYMAAILEANGYSRKVKLVPPVYDARQTKYIISQCDLLMAARTHATIAGFSSAVPTISLAYSRKAHGINLDLFGHERWVVDIRNVSAPDEVVQCLRRMGEELDPLSSHLSEKAPEIKRSALSGAEKLGEVLEKATP